MATMDARWELKNLREQRPTFWVALFIRGTNAHEATLRAFDSDVAQGIAARYLDLLNGGKAEFEKGEVLDWWQFTTSAGVS